MQCIRYSIVGMGGIGKTTIAQLAYNDVQVKDVLKLRMWVSVSTKTFDLIKITKSIIESATETSCSLSDLNPLQAKLQSLLKDKRFLLVLDDVWSEKPGDWDILFTSLQVGGKGSKVIVTTRSEVVSSIVGQGLVYNLKPLTDDECWKVMEHKAFSNVNLMEDDNLAEIGRNIAKKCKGLPLAAKVLGSVLHFKSSEQDWISILESDLWDLPEDKNEIFPSLALSYHHLPAHLKKCFAYCSIFPLNYQFVMDELVLIWMAEGFIWPRGQIRLEDIGNEYFMDLARRSFFHFSHTLDVEGFSKRVYVMHDLIHDLAHLVSSNTCFPLENNFSQYSHAEFKNPRHLSLQLNSMQTVQLKAPNWLKNLRTFILVSENSSCLDQVPYELFTKLKSIRVLNLSHAGINELPGSIDCMKHLRYLNLSKTNICKLPESITKLCGLQTLNLTDCTSFLELPVNLKNLTNLRHLDLDVKRQLRSMPSGLGSLTKIQTLSAFIVGDEGGRTISELKNMQLLRGSICITNLEKVSNATEVREASLDQKSYIDKLILEWKHIRTTSDQQMEILQYLKPHKNVKNLVIKKYSGPMFPFWLTDPLCRFRTIELQTCQNCRNLPSLGFLRFLKSLYIGCMPSLALIGREFCGNPNVTAFPALETLIFEDMPKLREWNDLTVSDMPKLHELTIMDCPLLIGLPTLYGLNVLHSLNIAQCPKLESLPEGGLPDSLSSLIILQCPKIKSRCRFRYGEDWEKIQNVRKIEIDYQRLESSISALWI
ncbi:hypothetical protein Leryth_000299 [Lithospermum erythrorhizon]|nr:hypothetical protein Leryth_000299 [Lithospermum erythrorhizon]